MPSPHRPILARPRARWCPMSPTAIVTGSALMESPNSLTAPMAWFSLDVHAVLSRTVTTLGEAIPARANSLPVSAIHTRLVFLFINTKKSEEISLKCLSLLTLFTISFNRHTRQCGTLWLEVRYLRTRIFLHPLLDLLELDCYWTVLYRWSALQRRETRLRLARGRRGMPETS